MHLFRRILAPVIKIDGFRHAIARNRLAQGMLDDDLIQCGIESGIHHITAGIVDEGDQIGLLFGAFWTDGQIRSIFNVALIPISE